MKVRAIMTTPIVTCHAKDSLAGCAQIMRDRNLGFLPVVDDDGDVVGVVTDRDLTTRGLAAGRAPSDPVEVVASADVVTCRAEDELWYAETMLARARKTRLVVMDDGRAVGIVSLSDLGQVEEHDRFGWLYQLVTQRETSRPLPRRSFPEPPSWTI